ncbi:MAG: sigma-70 family RNA polymerase sigma factor [Oscillochloris sp.]|nr:sigma-70 family RNA polymerase sigma factor [Oscillochloris sp.]
MSDHADDMQLYAACGDEGSLRQVDAFEQLWAFLYRRAWAMVHDRRSAEQLAADCTQVALIKIHRSYGQCREPERFRAWAAQIMRRTVIDELRRPEHRPQVDLEVAAALPSDNPSPEAILADADLARVLRAAITGHGLSDRSQRVVIGRFFAEQSDEVLAAAEQALGAADLRPSHIQVTRAKNLAKLRADPALLAQLQDLLAG